jgi:hypothetical protein
LLGLLVAYQKVKVNGESAGFELGIKFETI